MIARTETKWAQNESSLRAYEQSPDIKKVIAFDAQLGPDRSDPDCIARNGREFLIKDARQEMGREHPNGTLSFAPVVRVGAPRTDAAGQRGAAGPFGPLAENAPIPNQPIQRAPLRIFDSIQNVDRTFDIDELPRYRNTPPSSADAKNRIKIIEERTRPALEGIDGEIDEAFDYLDNKINAIQKRVDELIDSGDLSYEDAWELMQSNMFDFYQTNEFKDYIQLLKTKHFLEREISDKMVDAIAHRGTGNPPKWNISGKEVARYEESVDGLESATFSHWEKVPPSLDDIDHTRRAMDEFARLIPDWPDELSDVDYYIVPGRAGCGRLESNIRNSQIFYQGANEDIAVIIHEMGHAIENADLELFQEAVEFIYERTKSEKLRRMRDITGIDYHKSEVTREDLFFNPYIGKEYSVEVKHWKRWYGNDDFGNDPLQYVFQSPWDKKKVMFADELVSMGIEAMWSNPYKFILDDEGHFDFIFERVMYRNKL